MSRYLHKISFFLIWSTLLGSSAIAQNARGTIVGTVKDASNAVLPGASVEIQPSGKKVVSDGVGQYRISDVAPGDYSISASYVGFAAFSGNVKVDAGQVSKLDLQLAVANHADEVMVTADRLHGEAEAINIQRTADNIVQVLPSDVIQSLPNTNIADAVGRAPSVTLERDEGEGKYVQIRGTEPRLSNTTIDGVEIPSPEGNVRNIKLDIIPSALVDRIEVNKTLSANQDADAIGGSVNLVTRTPRETPYYSFGGTGGYTPIQNGRWLDSFDGTAGRRFGTNKKFGIMLTGTFDHNDRAIDDFEALPVAGQTSGGQNIAYFSTADLRTYRYNRTRYGFDTDLDYAFSPNSTVYLKGLYSDFHDYGDVWVYSPSSGVAPVSQANGITTFADNGNMAYREYVRRPDQQVFSYLAGGHHDLTSNVFFYNVSVSRSHNIGGQDFPSAKFNPVATPGNDLTSIPFSVNASDPVRPNFVAANGVNVFDPNSYQLSSYSVPIYHSTQINYQGDATWAHRYNAGGHYGTFEMGALFREGHKTQLENDTIYDNPTAGAPLMSSLLSAQTNPGYYDKSFGGFGPMTSFAAITRALQANPGILGAPDVLAGILRSNPADYDAKERVYAGYAMNTISFNKWRFETGLRIEATDAAYSANRLNFSAATGDYQNTQLVHGTSGYINVLPSVQVQYQLTPDTNLRASFGMGISRPNFSDIVPSQQVDPNTTPPSLSQGNPALQPTKAKNYDLLAEHFFSSLGVIQAGYFYKSLSDPIYPTANTQVGGQFDGYRVFQSINGPNGYIGGVEMAWEQRLSRLPGALNGFGVSANYSYTYSQVSFPAGFNGGRTDHPSLERQAPNTWNLGFTYDKSRFSMRFGVSYNDANIYAYNYGWTDLATSKDPILGLKGPTGDIYLYAHTQYDVQGSYRLYRGLRLVASGLNLSNEVFGFYQGSTQYPIQREYYHPSYSFGLRWTSSSEK